jgi:uncharacterized membrane protein YhaH (DUF805 family)
MGFAAAIFTCLRKSGDFRGRARRREFWSFLAFWIAVATALAFELPHGPITTRTLLLLAKAAPVLLIPAALTVPLAAVAVRRLHDIGLSGWWLMSAAAPVPVLDLVIVGAQVVCLAKPGTTGPNRYGPDPRGDAATEAT